MRAFQLAQIGAPPAFTDLPRPSPGPGEALIRIAACGLNFADTLMLQGRYQDMPALPFTMGMELAGWVEALGPDTKGPPPGSRVAVYAGQGGLAQWGCFPVARLLPLPDSLPMTEAAGFLIAYGTSHLALTRAARLAPGETLLVTGAAGGVGLTAVEIGHALGARVIALARGPEKLALARAAGATQAIDSDTPDLKAQLKALGGIDVAYDAVGGAGFDAILRAMRPEGRILAIGFASGQVPPVPANLLLVKNVAVIGFYWGGYLKFAPQALNESLATLLEWHSQGRIRPHVSQVLPLDQAEAALALLASRRATGKVVVEVSTVPPPSAP